MMLKGHPPPGRMIDVDGHQTHVEEMGAEHKTALVILDADIAGCVLDWVYVQPEIAQFARVIAYDRAGYGWSDEAGYPRYVMNAAAQLYKLILQLSDGLPVILVAHGYAAMIAFRVAVDFPDTLAGIIVMNASVPYLKRSFPIRGIYTRALFRARLRALLKRLRLDFLVQMSLPAGLPDSSQAAYAAHLRRSLDVTVSEKVEELSYEAESEKLGSLPLIVLYRTVLNTEFSIFWQVLQQPITFQSQHPATTYYISEQDVHHLPLLDPQFVIDAVREMVGICTTKGTI